MGVVIGKGGDMIKKIQAETGARVQFQQAREEGPGERRCYLSGKPQNVEQVLIYLQQTTMPTYYFLFLHVLEFISLFPLCLVLTSFL